MISKLEQAAREEAKSLRLDFQLVYRIMLKGALVATEDNTKSIRADRLKAEHGPGSESIRAGSVRIIPLPVHPKNL